MDSTKVSGLVARQLSDVVPPMFTIEEHAGDIIIRAVDDPIGMRSHFRDLVGNESPKLGLEIAVLNVLDLIQDYISIWMKEPWPASGQDERGGLIPSPDVRVEGNMLYFAYIADGLPLLVFEPISLSDCHQ